MIDQILCALLLVLSGVCLGILFWSRKHGYWDDYFDCVRCEENGVKTRISSSNAAIAARLMCTHDIDNQHK